MYFVYVVLVPMTFSVISADYWRDREQFVKLEESQILGAGLLLNQKEQFFNILLMSQKRFEYSEGFLNPEKFAPERHFFDARDQIEQSPLFDAIRQMPKGAALHGHDVSIVSEDFIYNVTFRENLYACTSSNGKLHLMFLAHETQNPTCNWTLLSTLRARNASFDGWLKSKLTLRCSDPLKRYTTINDVWSSFKDIFLTIFEMVTYRPVFYDLLYQAMKELREDNVMYLEFRGVLPPVYELNGTVYDSLEVARMYSDIIADFKRDFPDFLGARFIYGPRRGVSNATFHNYVQIAKSLKANYPDMFAGFDLVGQEDLGQPTSAFVDDLLEMSSHGIDFFFHAGETNWYGTSSDEDLIDSILLGTKRIGHGYAAIKHPLVLKMIKDHEIAIEICPISNQVLKLVQDLRNHPAAVLISQGYPVVISYDDPGYWGSKGLSYDFYLTFMGLASRKADLRLIKQLIINSIMYSAMPSKEKKAAYQEWESRWYKFIDDVIGDNAEAYNHYQNYSQNRLYYIHTNEV